MKTSCFACGRELDRPPSRLKANPTQFCNFVCLGAYRSRQVDVICAICGKAFQVKASQATHPKACSPACLGKLRSSNRVRYFGTEQARQALCARCGKSFTRKPSQLAKYGESFCTRACHNASKIGQPSMLKTGEWVPCEVCGKQVWRTPATKRAHVFCSYACAGQLAAERTGRRSPYVALTCEVCGKLFERSPGNSKGAKHCSEACRLVANVENLRQSNARRKGQPGASWPDTQRAKVSATLRAKYQAEWIDKGARHAAIMTAAGNPQWQDGRALAPYSPGFIRSLKRLIHERDGNCCRICGVAKSKVHPLPVHHRDGGKSNHDPSNLISLCHSCHGLVHQGKLECPA